MIRSIIINKYLTREFLKIIITISLVFFALGFIINLFEEINFFKDLDVKINVPLLLSALFVPSMIYNMFPFVVLFSGIWFFLKIKKTDEIIAMKVSGMSNFSVIMVPSFVSIILGIFFITLLNPITSILVKKYESIRGSYETQQFEYLATVNTNGIWIKEKSFGKNYIISALNLNKQSLIDLTIYEFDYSHNFTKRIEAKSADISSVNWKIYDAQVVDKDGKIISKNVDNLSYRSMYDIKKIKSLYSNLDTISFWDLDSEIKILEERGYSTREMRTKLQRSLAFPFFLLNMVLLSGVFTLGKQSKENNHTYVFT